MKVLQWVEEVLLLIFLESYRAISQCNGEVLISSTLWANVEWIFNQVHPIIHDSQCLHRKKSYNSFCCSKRYTLETNDNFFRCYSKQKDRYHTKLRGFCYFSSLLSSQFSALLLHTNNYHNVVPSMIHWEKRG
jgi:hypothetical protein